MLESLFNTVAGLKVCNFIIKRLEHRCFPLKFAKFLRTPFYRAPPVAASVNTPLGLLTFFDFKQAHTREMSLCGSKVFQRRYIVNSKNIFS